MGVISCKISYFYLYIDYKKKRKRIFAKRSFCYFKMGKVFNILHEVAIQQLRMSSQFNLERKTNKGKLLKGSCEIGIKYFSSKS